MQRIFIPSPLDIDITITDTQIHHQLTRVMRIQVGDHVILFDGDGSETEYEVMTIDKKSLSLRGQNRVWPRSEPKKQVTLYQAMPNKQEKIEYILQKGVEVGISRFIFFRSERSQKLSLSPSKRVRMTTIVQEAVEQCGGLRLPEVEFLEEMPDPVADITHLVLDTTGDMRRIGEFPDMGNIGLWVGPEGGWSDDERNKMSEKGFIFVRFGERILRTETAGIVVAFSLLHA